MQALRRSPTRSHQSSSPAPRSKRPRRRASSCCGLGTLLQKAGAARADYLKLDLEGAEYALLREASTEDLAPFRQVFVEFHHHCISGRTEADTREVVRGLRERGLEAFSLDDHNYLFYGGAVNRG